MSKITAPATIEMGKQYKTRDGRSVRLLCTDCENKDYPVVAIIAYPCGNTDVYSYTAEGRYLKDSGPDEGDLIEYSPWSDVAVDTKILVRGVGSWIPRHFSHYADGFVHAWDSGWTSHTTERRNAWGHAKLAE